MENSKKRLLTNDDVKKYEPMVEMFLRDKCMKNWSDARAGNPEAFLGTSGYSLNDIRQHLRTEVCVALQNYNPAYLTKEGKSVKESTFIYQHLTFRVGQMMKRLTKRRTGYGIRHTPFDLLLKNEVQEESVLELDMVSAIDGKRNLKLSNQSQVATYLEKVR